MVQKYVRGLPISAPQLNGISTDDELAIDFKSLDLAEQEEHILRAQDELKSYDDRKTQELAKKAAEAKKRAESDLKELEELRELKKKIRSNNP